MLSTLFLGVGLGQDRDCSQRAEVIVMRGFRAGVGMAVGAGLGLVFGLLLFDGWWVGPMIGVGLGLVVGAVVDLQSGSGADQDD